MLFRNHTQFCFGSLDHNGTVLASDQASLSRDGTAILNGSSMAPGKHTIDRHVPVKEGKNLGSTRSRTPIAHKVANNGKQADHLHTGFLHAGVRGVADEFSSGSGTFDVGEDGVTFGAKGQGKESSADIGSNSGNNNLLLAGSLDGFTELWVIPGANYESVRPHRD